MNTNQLLFQCGINRPGDEAYEAMKAESSSFLGTKWRGNLGLCWQWVCLNIRYTGYTSQIGV